MVRQLLPFPSLALVFFFSSSFPHHFPVLTFTAVRPFFCFKDGRPKKRRFSLKTGRSFWCLFTLLVHGDPVMKPVSPGLIASTPY